MPGVLNHVGHGDVHRGRGVAAVAVVGLHRQGVRRRGFVVHASRSGDSPAAAVDREPAVAAPAVMVEARVSLSASAAETVPTAAPVAAAPRGDVVALRRLAGRGPVDRVPPVGWTAHRQSGDGTRLGIWATGGARVASRREARTARRARFARPVWVCEQWHRCNTSC